MKIFSTRSNDVVHDCIWFLTMLYMMLYSVFRKIRRSFSFSDNLVIKDSIFVQFSDAVATGTMSRNISTKYCDLFTVLSWPLNSSVLLGP